LGLEKITVSLTANRQYNLLGMLEAIKPDTKLIYVCNPNNPTGAVCNREALVDFVKEATKKAIVLVDEAYLDFTDQQSLSGMVGDNKNLIIAKTFSKIYGLAGARVGYGLANAATIAQMSQLLSFANGCISVVSASGALAALKDEKFVRDTYYKNEQVRKYTMDWLQALNLTCIPSSTNFIYFSLANYQKNYFKLLKDNNIMGSNIYEEDGKWTRITIGKMEEMKKFISVIQ
jgi:histidinol-phosphate aminotransferase